VVVVSGDGFGAPNYIRLTFARNIGVLKEGLDRIEVLLATV
jgi:aspartate/methionine/tyrosine aminotransferase